jgi:hypothetical protein
MAAAAGAQALLRLGAWLAHQDTDAAAAVLSAGLRSREDDAGWLALADVCMKASDEHVAALAPAIVEAVYRWLPPAHHIPIHWADTGLVPGAQLWPSGAHVCPLCSGRMSAAGRLRAHVAAHGLERVARAAVVAVRGPALVCLPRELHGCVLRRAPPVAGTGTGTGDAAPRTDAAVRERTCRVGVFRTAAREAFVRGPPPLWKDAD